MDETNPTVRSLRCLELLQDHPGITAARLGGLLGVSERAARRYVAILREAGLPIEAERGRYGGYRVGRGLRLRPLMFTAPEALSLVMAVLEGGHDADAADDPVQTALGKIMRVLPESLAGPAEAVRRVSTRKRGDGTSTPPPETTARLVEACGSTRRVRIDYLLGDGTRTMELDPWAVIVRYGRWYLLCWSHTSGARRALRLDRVMSVELRPETFDPPEGLDAAVDLDEHLRQGWSARVVVEVEATLDDARRWVPQQLGRLEATAEPGRTRIVGSTDDLPWYVGHLAAFEVDYRIIEPTELQQCAHVLGTRLLRAAGSP